MNVTTKFHLKFFDSAAVLGAVDKARVRVLSRIGAFIWRREKSSMRRTKKSAPPGQPPRAHAGQLKDLNFFSYDASTRSVVIGPVKFGTGTAPRTLEEGGSETIQSHGKRVTAYYRPHPFMRPALEAELRAGTLPREWANSVRT